MVEQVLSLDDVFGALADPTRRDILRRVSHVRMSVSEIAEPYKISLAAISKHLRVLERAKLIVKERRGKQQVVDLSPLALESADTYLQQYREVWQDRHDKLAALLQEE